MPLGSRRRRTALGFALTVSAGLAGCQGVPAPRPNPAFQAGASPEDIPAGTVKAAPSAGTVTDPMTLPPLPTQEAEAAPAATPLLDAAMARAEAQREAVLSELVGETTPTPVSSHASDPAETHVETPATTSVAQEKGPGPSNEPAAPSPIPNPEQDTSAAKSVAPQDPVASSSTQSPLPTKDEEPLEPSQETAPKVAAATVTESAGRSPRAPLEEEPVAPQLTTASATASPTIQEAPRGTEPPSAMVQVLQTLTGGAGQGDDPLLEIADLRLCQRVRGFGVFEPLEPSACKSGLPVILYCEMAGLRYERSGEAYHSRMASSVDLVPLGEETPLWHVTLGTAEDTCSRRRRDYYVNYRLTLPETLRPGPYQLRLTQKDELAGRTTSRTLSLTIVP